MPKVLTTTLTVYKPTSLYVTFDDTGALQQVAVAVKRLRVDGTLYDQQSFDLTIHLQAGELTAIAARVNALFNRLKSAEGVQ